MTVAVSAVGVFFEGTTGYSFDAGICDAVLTEAIARGRYLVVVTSIGYAFLVKYPGYVAS